MPEEEIEVLRSIERTLKQLLRLQIEDTFDEKMTNKQKVKQLHESGFNTPEMAEIIGTTEGSIRGTISTLRSDGEIEKE